MKARLDWTKIGAEYTRDDAQKKRILAAIDQIDGGFFAHAQFDEWLRMPGGDEKPLTLGMMQGEGIKATIRELRLPRVSHVAVSSALAPFGFYGIRAHYKGGETVDVFVVDTGDGITPILARVTEPEPVAA